jgi:undecaprenyl-diphosphatase
MKPWIKKRKPAHLTLFWSYIALLLIAAFIFDTAIILFFYAIRNIILTAIMQVLTSIYIVLAVFAIAVILLWKTRQQWLLGISALIALFIAIFLQYLIARPRPNIEHLATAGGASFPSMHAAFLFAMVPFLDKDLHKSKKIWLTLIILIAVSRLYLGVHYLSDIIFGAAIGYTIGYIFAWSQKKYSILEKLEIK